ncbi:ogr/Delta-like zinc finger family protein [Comamonas antarctica]|uniref:Ogr/Delta-like zinc finger family protein n=1 Tax=Comamonas antarctica TaxID=2743470 RepID=A0A6N1WZQ2_9BURK|nr:ogr/Delta-like zinc finger family protein [Comamonas antarctica]QKV52629.1 ogr/Delta-like zinc finger family protein [Comamonas antarctica]
MYSPFDLDTTRAQQAHSSFVLSAVGVGVRRVVIGKKPAGNAGGSSQTCNNVETGSQSTVEAETRHGAELPSERTRLECPHCELPCIIRSSRRMSKLTRETVYSCLNPECGHAFVALTEIVRTTSLSSAPDPTVHLPLSDRLRRDLLRALLDYAPQAKHIPMFAKPKPVTGDLFSGNAPPAD